MEPKKGPLHGNTLRNLPTNHVSICIAFLSFGFYGYGAHPLNLIFPFFSVPLFKKKKKKKTKTWQFTWEFGHFNLNFFSKKLANLACLLVWFKRRLASRSSSDHMQTRDHFFIQRDG
jgi:hypothetical protein